MQQVELDAASGACNYTLPGLIEASRFQVVAGEAELLPGVWLMPTPGHADGHQSLILRRPDGVVIVAGQSHDTATQYAADQLAWRARRDGHSQPLPNVPAWIDTPAAAGSPDGVLRPRSLRLAALTPLHSR